MAEQRGIKYVFLLVACILLLQIALTVFIVAQSFQSRDIIIEFTPAPAIEKSIKGRW